MQVVYADQHHAEKLEHYVSKYLDREHVCDSSAHSAVLPQESRSGPHQTRHGRSGGEKALALLSLSSPDPLSSALALPISSPALPLPIPSPALALPIPSPALALPIPSPPIPSPPILSPPGPVPLLNHISSPMVAYPFSLPLPLVSCLGFSLRGRNF